MLHVHEQNNGDHHWQFESIGVVQSCYKEKFGIPRQANLVTEARGTIQLRPAFQQPGILRGLADFSHVWLTFVFHQTLERAWHPTIRPPRLGGNQRVGVFASRSTHRPNGIGLSVVKLDNVDVKTWTIHYIGGDLLDGTPILDIKPYLAYADSIRDAQSAYAQTQPDTQPVYFSDVAIMQCQQLQARYTEVVLPKLIEQILQQDPRPAYQQASDRVYAMKLFDFDLHWRYDDRGIEVICLQCLSTHLDP